MSGIKHAFVSVEITEAGNIKNISGS